MKISKSELTQIIKEEIAIFKKQIKLQNELAEIEKELNEVKAGGEMDPNSNDGVHAGQRKPVFSKKGTHLVEDDIEDTMETSDEDANADLMDAIKKIAKACGLSGVIELDSEEENTEDMGMDDVDSEMGDLESSDEEEMETPSDEEEAEEETVEIEPETEEVDVEMAEECNVSEESSKEEHLKDAAEDDYAHAANLEKDAHEDKEDEMKENIAEKEPPEAEGAMINESLSKERKRMIELAGLSKK